MDSRLKSFHHKKVVKTKKNTDNNKKKRESFILTHRTKLDIEENKANETKKGQKEVCTGRKGLKNIN
jgi:hypothetical protein